MEEGLKVINVCFSADLITKVTVQANEYLILVNGYFALRQTRSIGILIFVHPFISSVKTVAFQRMMCALTFFPTDVHLVLFLYQEGVTYCGLAGKRIKSEKCRVFL